MFVFWVPAYRIHKDRAPSYSQKEEVYCSFINLAILYQLLMKVTGFLLLYLSILSGLVAVFKFSSLLSLVLHPPFGTPKTNPVGNTFFQKIHGCGDGGEDLSTSEIQEIVCCCWFKLLYCEVHLIASVAGCFLL